MSNQEQKETKPECLHNFVPVEADNQGKASSLKCTKCGKKMLVG